MPDTSHSDLQAQNERLRKELEESRLRAEEAEQALETIHTGQVESLVVEGPNGTSIFTLANADRSYRVLVEAMNEGAATLSADGTILYCNSRFAEMLDAPLERVMGSTIHRALPERSRLVFDALAREADSGESRGEVELIRWSGERLPAYLSASAIHDDGGRRLCLVATDLRVQKRNEQIVAAERLTRLVIEQSEEAIIVCDEDARVIRASAAAERLCGTNLLLRRFDEVFTIEITEQAVQSTDLRKFQETNIAEAALRGAVARVAPATLSRPDGTHADLLVSANALKGEGDRVHGCVINLVDISELGRAQRALQQSTERERFLAEVLENATTAFGVGAPDGSLIFFNQFFAKLTGYTREELEQRRITWVTDLTPLEWRKPEAEILSNACRSGLTARYEKEYVRKDGSRVPIELTVQPVLDSRGGVIHYRSFISDITERKRLERLYEVRTKVSEVVVRTRDEQTLLREVCRIVAERALFPVVWVGLVNGRAVAPVAVSGARSAYVHEIKVELEGTLGQGPTGTCIRENRPIINDDFDSNPRTAAWRQTALCHGIRASAAFPLRNGDRAIGAFTLYAERPGAFDADQVRLLEAISEDISYALVALEHERKRAETEAALRDADRRKNDFLASLSHELRNPLAPIKNSLYVLERAQPGSSKAMRSLAVINRQSALLTRLVDDLLDVTRITRNKIQLRPSRVDLNELVRAVVEDLRSIFANAEVQLEPSLATDTVYVNVDSNRLTQVVGNLLQNAAKFTDRGGTTWVRVTADSAQHQAVIEVEDNGIGIAPGVLERLFQPFVQADQTLDRSLGGLGLGLALVKGLVELHGGTVAARSAGLGEGSAFEVRLPLVHAEIAVTLPAAKERTRRRRVLVIEDNVDAADSLHMALEFCGHQVTVAYSGHEGLASARELRPQVVLCDIGLPGMDGYEVARTLRADDTLRGLYLVALSGYALPEDLKRAEDAGFDQHLAKPPSLEKIEELLNNLPCLR
jgi:PAS domain S-box-containing protein